MEWYELAILAIYVQAFIWYGRLSYVQGVLDRHHSPDSPRVRKVLYAAPLPVFARSFRQRINR
jgi:hypothetical protein